MTKPPLKVGMIGAGYILKSHATSVAALPGLELHAVADTSRYRAEDAARQFGFDHAFTSIDEIAASDCDVVHVLVPPFLHLGMAEKLLRAGKSVFLEKPMGLSSADCAAVGELAEAQGLRLGVNHNFLFLPGYERLRAAVTGRELGRIDHLTSNWHLFLPQIHSGPFDLWMLSAPANLFFELGPHAAAFVLDLMGDASVSAAVAANPVELPSGQTAYRSWSVIGESGPASFAVSVSASQGQADRTLRVRASAGNAQVDFGRDIAWFEKSGSANPIFDAYGAAREISGQIAAAAGPDRTRRLRSSLAKRPDNSPYGESIFRSIARFYDAANPEIDPRHHWRFGAKVMKFCEDACAAAGVGEPTQVPISIDLPASVEAPKVLVVGATGFIGRRLVAKLIEKGTAVRVLSRSRNAAALAFRGLPVDVHGGFHGDPGVAARAVEGVETVFHLAKCDGQKWDDYVHGDIEPTQVLAEAALAAGVKRFIYTGTIDSHDSASSGQRITGDTPLDRRIATRNLYARSKAACEALLRRMASEQGLPLIVARPGIVIGAGTNPAHVGVANFISGSEVRYWGTGANKLPLVLVDDVADALVLAAEAPAAVGRTLLLTSDPLLSAQDYIAELSADGDIKVQGSPGPAWRDWIADFIKEAAKQIVRHPNRRSSTLHDWRCRAHRSTYDSGETREVLGWRPVDDRETLVRRGIREAIAAANR